MHKEKKEQENLIIFPSSPQCPDSWCIKLDWHKEWNIKTHQFPDAAGESWKTHWLPHIELYKSSMKVLIPKEKIRLPSEVADAPWLLAFKRHLDNVLDNALNSG